MNPKIQEVLAKIQDAAIRYPLVLMASIWMAFFAIISIEVNDENQFIWLKLILVSGLGISLLFALKMLSQRMKKGIWLELLGVAFLVGYYFLLPEKEEDFTEYYAFLLVPTFILSHLLVAFVAFIKRENSEHHFWQYNKSLFVNIFLTAVFTGVLTGGVQLAILAVDKLFNMNFQDEWYGQVAVFLTIFGSTVIFLLFNETGLDFLEKEGKYPVVLKFFTQYVLIPLLSIYVVILYLYSAKILVNWELPRGWVSYLVLAYSIVGILALLLVHPLKEESTKSWVKMFSRVFYFTLIPLIVLLFIAIFTRVLEYGYTEPRYFVLLLAVWLTTVVLYFIFRKNPTIKFIPISLFCFGLFALIFPYFNTFSVAKRSQMNELEKILTQNNLLKNGKIDFTKEIQDTVAYEIADKFEFLDDRHQKDYLNSLLDENSQEKYQGYYANLANGFSNRKYTSTGIPAAAEAAYMNLTSKGGVYSIYEYQFMVAHQELENRTVALGNDSLKLIYSSSGDHEYKLVLNNDETLDLIPLINEFFEKHKTARNYQQLEEISVEGELGKYHVKVLFQSINRSELANGKFSYWYNNPIFLIKENSSNP